MIKWLAVVGLTLAAIPAHAQTHPLASCSIEGDMRTGVVWDDESNQLNLIVLEGDDEREVVRIPSTLSVVEAETADGIERNFMFQTSGPTRYRLRLMRAAYNGKVTAELHTRMGDGDWNVEPCNNADLSANLYQGMPAAITDWQAFVSQNGSGWGP